MNTAPAVSVVIATRNRLPFLVECVDSVIGQKAVAWELIVVDDASTDGTAAWLRSLDIAGVSSRRMEQHDERCAARNLGLTEAKGKYVMFLDDDDFLHPGALSLLTQALDEHPEAVAAVGARRVWFTAEDYRRRDAHPRRLLVRDVFEETLFGWSAISGQNLYRTDAVRRIGGYVSSFIPCEDRDLWLSLLRFGKVALRPEMVMTYRVRASQQRPADILLIRERVARKAIRALPKERRRRALRLRRSNALLDQAEASITGGRCATGLVLVLRALAAAPTIYLSPLIGEWVFRRLVGRCFRRFFPPKTRPPAP
jgi:glycosyltransferase involved in cell wall biosynthesis